MDNKIRAIYLLTLTCECSLNHLTTDFLIAEILNRYNYKYHIPFTSTKEFIGKFIESANNEYRD